MHRITVLWWGFNGLFYWEEAYRLLIGEALWHRWPWPLLDLQADPYAGGSLVISVLAAPFVALMGPSLAWLKLIALAWSTVGLVTWTLLLDRWWGRRAAHIFAFLFVFAPPLFVTYNLIAMGSHAEVVTLAGVQLLLAYRWLYGTRRSTGALVAWAAVAGFGTWFTYVSFLPFLVCVGVGVVGGALPLRRWPALAGGFLVGFAPWVFTNLVSGGRGLDVVVRTFHAGGHSCSTALESLRYLVLTGIPLGLRFPEIPASVTGGAPRRLFLAHVYFALYVASWGAVFWACLMSAWRRTGSLVMRLRTCVRSCPELPLLALFPTFVLILAVSDQVFLEHELVPFLSFRLLVPFLPPVMAVLAIATARLPTRLRWAMLPLLGLIGMMGTTRMLGAGAAERPRFTAQARALGAQALGHLLYYKHEADMPLLAERIGVIPADLQASAWEGFGFSLAYHYPEHQPIEGFVRTVAAVPRRFRAAVERGVRAALGPGMEQVKPRPPSPRTDALLAALASHDPPKPDQ